MSVLMFMFMKKKNYENLQEWLDSKVTPLVQKMKKGAYIIINDVNSPNMGRNIIQEWAYNLKESRSVEADFFTFIKLIPSKIYPGEMYELKFDSKVNSTTIYDNSLIFQDSYSITESEHCLFDKTPTDCGSCFIILQVI